MVLDNGGNGLFEARARHPGAGLGAGQPALGDPVVTVPTARSVPNRADEDLVLVPVFGPQVPTVPVTEIADDAYLLDVREDDEWAAGHAPGAHHLPMMELPARLAEVPTDRDVVVVCRSGGRSAQVVAYLITTAGSRCATLDGGMRQWAAAGRPVVERGRAAGQVI